MEHLYLSCGVILVQQSYHIQLTKKKFFDKTKNVIFFNYGSDYIYMFILEIFYATAIFFSNPINLFPVYESIYQLKYFQKIIKDYSPKKTYWTKYCVRIFIVIICFTICLFIPNFIAFISFVGSFIFPIIGIYIPVI